jgi:hypothetical protein
MSCGIAERLKRAADLDLLARHDQRSKSPLRKVRQFIGQGGRRATSLAASFEARELFAMAPQAAGPVCWLARRGNAWIFQGMSSGVQ